MPKSDREKAEIRQQMEARRQTGKDRSGHDAKRGEKKIKTLDDLTNEQPTEGNLNGYLRLINKESDRGAAVMLTSFVEQALEDALRANLADYQDGSQNRWFRDRGAPFGDFGAKTALGKALGIIGPQMESKLNVIRRVRNVFAHRLLPIDFTHPLIEAECNKVLTPSIEDAPTRLRFSGLCLAIIRQLAQYTERTRGRAIDIVFP